MPPCVAQFAKVLGGHEKRHRILELYWSWNLVFTCLLVCAILSLLALTLLKLVDKTIEFYWTLIGGAIVYFALVGAYGFVYYGSEASVWVLAEFQIGITCNN